MSHMVIYRGADGKPGYHQTDDIHDAVMYVESLRNDKDVDHARIFRLEEVTFEYKPYYRVELSVGGAPAAATPAAVAASNGSSDDADDDSDDDVLETTEADVDDDDDDDDDNDDADDAVDSDDDGSDDSDNSDDDDDSDDDDAPAAGVRRGLFGR